MFPALAFSLPIKTYVHLPMFIFPFLGTQETCFERVKRVKDPLDILAHKNNLFL